MCGYLSLRACQLSLAGVVTGGGAAPVKRWFSLHSDFVLYTFKSESDCQALTATPMPGYTVLTGPELKGESGIAEKDRDKTIKMFYAPLMTSQPCSSSVSAACRKAYFFTGTCLAEVKRLGWRWPPLCVVCDVCVVVFERRDVCVVRVFSFFPILSCLLLFLIFCSPVT